jgi:MoaA/NifB/PqqE/SkfB family radical SAM enzyme
MGTPLLIFTGGDPVNRQDLCDLIRAGKEAGLRTATIPAATDCLTRDLLARLKDAGVDQVAFSLDFPDAARHDAFRGVPGAYGKTMAAIEWAHVLGIPLQINTTVCGDTAPAMEAMAEFVQQAGIVFWEVFFLVPMGRGTLLQGLTAAQCEDLFEVIWRVQRKGGFIVKVTEAPHYRRYVAQRVEGAFRLREASADPPEPDSDAPGRRRAGADDRQPSRPEGAPTQADGAVQPGTGNRKPGTHPGMRMPKILTRSEGPGHTVGLAPRGVNSGNGFLFVSHTGGIFPSGFLPVPGGSVRISTLADVYRGSELFRTLRMPDRLKGRCGRCEYRSICGGSRSRAFALTGDWMQTDPWCGYQPKGDGVEPSVERGA